MSKTRSSARGETAMHAPLRARLALAGAALCCAAVWTAAGPIAASVEFTAPIGTFEGDESLSLLRSEIAARRESEAASLKASSDGSLAASLDLETGIYSLASTSFKPARLALAEGQTIHLRADEAQEDLLNVSGSPDTEILESYESARQESLQRLVYPVRETLKKLRAERADAPLIETETQREVEAYASHLRELNDFVLEKVGDSAALYATSLRWDADYRASELMAAVEAFEARHGPNAAAREMKERLNTTFRLAPGQTAPDIEGADLDGSHRALTDLRGQIALIDFWASWCPPCRVENRRYLQLKERFGDRFEILGVNLDTTRPAWARASAQDNINWPQISDLQGWKSPMAALYNVNALPTSVLIDAEGRILAKNLRGDALEAKLAELLGE